MSVHTIAPAERRIFSLLQLNQFFYQGQTNACTGVLRSFGWVRFRTGFCCRMEPFRVRPGQSRKGRNVGLPTWISLVKAIEDTGQVLGRNANARIGNG